MRFTCTVRLWKSYGLSVELGEFLLLVSISQARTQIWVLILLDRNLAFLLLYGVQRLSVLHHCKPL